MIKNKSAYLSLRNLGLMLVIAVLYFIIAQDNYLISFDNQNLSSILSASGFAFAAVLLLGNKIVPGIFIGAFAYNLLLIYTSIHTPLSISLLSAFVISITSTLQASFGNYLIHKLVKNNYPFDKSNDVFRFILVILFISLISATVNTLTLSNVEIEVSENYSNAFLSSWLSDIVGIIIITPLLVGWAKARTKKIKATNVTATILLYSLLFIVGGFVFLNWFPTILHFRKAYFTLPLLLWAAFSFEQREVVTAIAITATLAIFGTLKRLGPFSKDAIADSFVSEQIYVTIISIIILVLRAAINERNESEKESQQAHDELKILAEERNKKLITTLKEVEDYQNRIENVFNVLLKYTVMNFTEKAPISERADEIDAISAGLNTLGEELQYYISSEKDYTEELEKLNALLKESEQQIQTIFDNAPEAVIVMDADGIVERWNPTAEQIFGWTADEITGKPFHEFVIPMLYRDAYLKGIKRFLTDSKKHILNKPLEIEVVNRQGNLFTVSINVSPTLMKGKYLFIAFARDVTEIKKAEEKLYHAFYMINNTTDAIFTFDEKLNITFWNDACEKLYGYTEEEAMGKSAVELIKTETDREAAIKQLAETGLWTAEVFQYNRAEKGIPVLSAVSTLNDKSGKMIGYLSVNRDISVRKKFEQELMRSQSFLNSIVENIPNMLFIKDAKDLKFVRLNKAGEDLLGYSRNDLMGKNDYDFFTKEEADFFTNKDRAVLQSGKLFEIPEERIHTKNKGVRILETKKIPMFDDKGKPQYLLGISNDITERIKMEEDLKQKSEELARSNTELEQFAYVASHDLQEPLRMINSYVQLLANRYKDKLDNDAKDFIGFAVDGSNRMRNLINSLLEYSRINRVKAYELVDLNVALKDVLHDLDKKITENKAIIKNDVLPKVFGDSVLLSQLFLNLIINAIKFRGEKNPEIIITWKKQNDEYLFSVKDNGIGIQPQYKEKIFVIFQRLHSKEKYEGTGIGLAICKKIVERHGGKIWIESEIDKGTTFFFTIKENLKSPV